MSIVAAFHRKGENIVTGSSKGKILIIDPNTRAVLKSFRVGGSTIRSVEFARRGTRFLVNSSDRVIRVYDIKHIMELDEDSDPEPIQKLQDTVNRCVCVCLFVCLFIICVYVCVFVCMCLFVICVYVCVCVFVCV